MDRNALVAAGVFAALVALLAEGVDRNVWGCTGGIRDYKSPSSRRAWIEIEKRMLSECLTQVALLAEGVDRNLLISSERRNTGKSPSSRRAWIEISKEAMW